MDHVEAVRAMTRRIEAFRVAHDRELARLQSELTAATQTIQEMIYERYPAGGRN